MACKVRGWLRNCSLCNLAACRSRPCFVDCRNLGPDHIPATGHNFVGRIPVRNRSFVGRNPDKADCHSLGCHHTPHCHSLGCRHKPGCHHSHPAVHSPGCHCSHLVHSPGCRHNRLDHNLGCHHNYHVHRPGFRHSHNLVAGCTHNLVAGHIHDFAAHDHIHIAGHSLGCRSPGCHRNHPVAHNLADSHTVGRNPVGAHSRVAGRSRSAAGRSRRRSVPSAQPGRRSSSCRTQTRWGRPVRRARSPCPEWPCTRS